MTSTSGDSTNAVATTLLDSVRMLTTPAGSDFVAATTSANSRLVRPVWPGNLATTVQPAASAGPSARAVRMMGEFQGEMIPATPSGSGVELKVIPGAISA